MMGLEAGYENAWIQAALAQGNGANLVIIHERYGFRMFENAWEAALFALLAEQVPVSEFISQVAQEKARILADPKRVSESDLWKYQSLKDESIEVLSSCIEGKNLPSGDRASVSTSASATRHDELNLLTPEEGEIYQHHTESADSTPAVVSESTAILRARKDTKQEGETPVGERKMRDRAPIASVEQPPQSPLLNRSVKKRRTERGDESSLAVTMHIPMHVKGDLISYQEVEDWILPTKSEINAVKQRMFDDWITPLGLRQQDIVKATGLGASYICYLYKDMDHPNMTARRRVECYSVILQLLKKFDRGEVTLDDFREIRDHRIANRKTKQRGSPDDLEQSI
jgi:hypothetical protein